MNADKKGQKSVKVAAFIQARMGSTRLPGKVLKNLGRRTVIEHIVNRLQKSRLIERIVVVTSSSKKDDLLVTAVKEIGIESFRGAELDVLNRFYEGTKKILCAHIVRITGDCPLVDYELIDFMVNAHLTAKNDYTRYDNDTLPRGVGGEIFTLAGLKRAELEASQPHEREHVTPYFYLTPGRFKIGLLKPIAPVLRRPDLRLTLDTEEDFQLIEKIYSHFVLKEDAFPTSSVIRFLDAHPKLIELNKHITQRTPFSYESR